jgi:hypothetical protein
MDNTISTEFLRRGRTMIARTRCSCCGAATEARLEAKHGEPVSMLKDLLVATSQRQFLIARDRYNRTIPVHTDHDTSPFRGSQ